MLVLIHLERLRRLALERCLEAMPAQAGSSNLDGEQSLAAPSLAPTNPAVNFAARPTCRCGRYWLEPTSALHWSVDPVTHAPHAEERVENLGRITPAEKMRWDIGLQSPCADSTCAAFCPQGGQAPMPQEREQTDLVL